MTDKKAQKIVVDLALTDNDKNLIDSGIILARIFNKDLCLFYHTSNRNKTKEFQARQKLESHLKGIMDIPFHNQTTIHISHVKKAFLLSTLADEDEAILFVAGSGRFKDYSKAVTNSPIPCLFIPSENQATAFQKVILPIDFRKETSDSVLWSSWFGRYAN